LHAHVTELHYHMQSYLRWCRQQSLHAQRQG
jgi:hypothetical protein